MISFAREVKEELCTTPFDIERKKAILAGFVRINSSLSLSSEGTDLIITSTNGSTAFFFYNLIKELYSITPESNFKKRTQFAKGTSYTITIVDKGEEILEDLEIDILSDDISPKYWKNDNLYGGYLAGSFLATGSVNSPTSTNYHLEISLQYENYAKAFKKMLIRARRHLFTPEICARREKFIMYLKKSEQIANFLVAIGAVNSCMKFESIRVDRDFINSSHRLEMCDAANMQKTYEAAEAQVKMIRFIGISALKNEKAILVAKTRLANPEASLMELSDIIFENTQLDISKSNLNHIFRQIKKMYEEKMENGAS